MFELTLMQSMCIGHVDVKFSLHPSCQLVPNVQVTLLKLKNGGKPCGEKFYDEKVNASVAGGSKDTLPGE